MIFIAFSLTVRLSLVFGRKTTGFPIVVSNVPAEVYSISLGKLRIFNEEKLVYYRLNDKEGFLGDIDHVESDSDCFGICSDISTRAHSSADINCRITSLIFTVINGGLSVHE